MQSRSTHRTKGLGLFLGTLLVVCLCGATPKVQHKKRPDAYARLLQEYLTSSPRRAKAAKKRLLAKGSRAIPSVVRAFQNPRLAHRQKLLKLLSPLTRRKAKALAHAIRRGKGAQRSGAMYAVTHLVRRPPPRLERLLLWRLRRGPWYVRGAAAYALSRSRPTPRIRRALLRALKDHAWRVKGNAAAGLRRAGKRARKQLLRAKQHKDWSVRAAAQAILQPAQAHRVQGNKRAQGQRLRFLTYNICHGAGMDGSYSLSRIAAVIRRSKADIIGLQEVDQGTRRSLGHKQLARLAKKLKMHSRFGQAISFQGGRFGNGFLSRYPILSHKVHTIPKLGGWEPRSIIEALLSVPKIGGGHRKLRVFSTHLDNRSAPARMAAVAKLRSLLAQNKLPAVLLGDLNASPGSPTLQALGKEWYNPLDKTPLPSMPAPVPLFQIDYVLYHPRGAWRFVQAASDKSALAQIASDHRPLSMTLAWPDPHPTRRP